MMTHSIFPRHRGSRPQDARGRRTTRRRRLVFEVLEDRRVLSALAVLDEYGDGSDLQVLPESGLNSIQGIVFEDVNGNGQQDLNELPLVGVEVTIVWGEVDGNTVELTTVTDENGRYFFDVDPQGFIDIEVDAPGFERSPTTPIGEAPLILNLGMYIPAFIGGFVWEDSNGNGLQDPDELGIENVTVVLTGTDGMGNAVDVPTFTNSEGLYEFDDLIPGDYTVTFSAPAGYRFTVQDADGAGIKGSRNSDADPNTGRTETITVKSGQVIDYVDAGLYRPVSIGDFVWQDMNGDGLQDPDELGIENVTVVLTGTDGMGNAVDVSTFTNSEGLYRFDDLIPGDYTVTFSAPAGYRFTVQDADGAGIKGSRNSDADPNTGRTETITVKSGQVIDYVDAGLYLPVSIGDFVWKDLNGNGLQDDEEPGISDVLVELTGTDGVGNNVQRSTNSDEAGHYAFTDLRPGTYVVTFFPPAGCVFTLQDADGLGLLGEENSDADPLTGKTPEITLRSGDQANYVDAGLYVSSLAGTVYIDSNNNGQQDPGEWGIPGVYVQLLGTDDLDRPVEAWVRTDADGNFLFTNMRASKEGEGYELRQVHPEEFVDGKDTVGSLGGTIPESDVITEIIVSPADQGIDYLFGELGLKNPSKRFLLTINPRPLILIREPGSGVTEVNPSTRQEQRLEVTVDRLDVNRDGFVTPADALFVINHVNYGMSSGRDYVPPTQADVSGDGRVTALDVLLLINHLNQAERHVEPEYGGAEGEAWPFDDRAHITSWENNAHVDTWSESTGWREPSLQEDWDRWRVWGEPGQPMAAAEAEIGISDDRADDDLNLDDLITLLAEGATQRIFGPLV